MKIRHQELQAELAETNYPFEPYCTLSNDKLEIPQDVFEDFRLYPSHLMGPFHLSVIEVLESGVRLWFGNADLAQAMYASWDLPVTDGSINVYDQYNRLCGLIVSSVDGLTLLGSYPEGQYNFDSAATTVCSRCVLPTAASTVSGFVLSDGSVVSGQVWLLGEDGVILSTASSGSQTTIRVDVVGDPLFLQKLCENVDLFNPTNPIRSVKVVNGEQEFVCYPDSLGNLSITQNNHEAPDTALRVRPTADGLVFRVEGS